MIPQQLHYLVTDTPTTAAVRFCFRITGTKNNQQCSNIVINSIHRRLKWASDQSYYQLVPHNRSLRFSIDFEHPPPRFDVRNTQALANGVSYLQDHGYVVFRNVADAAQVQHSISLFWKFMNRFGAYPSTPSTWDKIPSNDYGIILQYGIGQSEFLWHTRTLPNVRKAFAAVWDTSDLITDFGGAVVLRPLINNCTKRKWRTVESWYHVDQNANSKPGLQTIQGSLVMSNQTRKTGGFVVLPGSWRSHDAVSERSSKYWNADNDSHFLLVPKNDPIFEKEMPLFVAAQPGDLILWDSRTVHCNTIGDENIEQTVVHEVESTSTEVTADVTVDVTAYDMLQKESQAMEIEIECNIPTNLQRIVALVSMCPRSFATEEVLSQRRKAVHQSQTTTHWPHLFVADDPGPWVEQELTELQHRLVG
jgi:hypothetical protein